MRPCAVKDWSSVIVFMVQTRTHIRFCVMLRTRTMGKQAGTFLRTMAVMLNICEISIANMRSAIVYGLMTRCSRTSSISKHEYGIPSDCVYTNSCSVLQCNSRNREVHWRTSTTMKAAKQSRFSAATAIGSIMSFT